MRLIAADFSAIEGRVTAWLAGEAWKLVAFRANDAGEGAGIYELTASSILSKPVEAISKAERQAYGKIPELALGFQGGVLAFDSMAKIYGVDMSTAYEPLLAACPPEIWAKAEKRYGVCLKSGTTGANVLTREQWIASEVTKLLWRERHPATVALWEGLEQAAFDAVTAPGVKTEYRGIRYVVRRGFLWCQMPSGRCLAYGAPRISARVWVEWLETGLRETMAPAEAFKAERLGELRVSGKARGAISALGVDSQTKKWKRFGLYGGLATENVVQGIARDLMAEGMLAAEAAGYPIIMTVHDEAVAEVPDDFGSVEEFEALLCTRGEWAATIPVVAKGYAAKRYRKD